MTARYTFEGEVLTVKEIAERCTAYGREWIGRAVKHNGATCIADLHQLYAEARARERRTQITARRTHIVIGKGH